MYWRNLLCIVFTQQHILIINIKCRVLNLITYTCVFINFCELHIHDKKSINLVVGYILFYIRENSFDLGSDGSVGSQSDRYLCPLPDVLLSSSVGATACCGLWPVEQYLSICPCLSPTLSYLMYYS